MDVGALTELRSELPLAWSLWLPLRLEIFLVHGWDRVLEASIPSLHHLVLSLLEFKTVDDLNGGLLCSSVSFSGLELGCHPLNWRLVVLCELDIILLNDVGGEGV